MRWLRHSLHCALFALFVSVGAFAVTCPSGNPCLDLNTQAKGSRMPFWGTDAGAANAYSITTTGDIGSGGTLQTGSRFYFKAANANTGASTLVVNGGSAIAIKKNVSSALTAGDIALNQIVEVFYDGTNFQLVGPGLVYYQQVYANGSLQTQRLGLNLIPGTNMGITCADNSGSNRTDCTFTASGGGGGSTFPLSIIQEGAFDTCCSNTTSFTVTFGQALAASGNTAWMIVSSDGSSTITAPTGWTVDINVPATTFARLIVAHKATAGETSATWTAGASTSFAVYFFEVSGSHSLDQSATGTSANPSNGITLFPSITPTSGAAVFGFSAVVINGVAGGLFIPGPLAPQWNTVAFAAPFATGRALLGHVYANSATHTAIVPPSISNPNVGLFSGGGVAYATFSIL